MTPPAGSGRASGTDPATTSEQAHQFLRERGAATIAHPGGKLLDHLVRTHEILRQWDAPEAVCLAGLCHAVYGTDGFPTALATLEERGTVRQLIGDEAEVIVYRYGSCDRSETYPTFSAAAAPFTDRFTGETGTITRPELESFALLTIANELDVARALLATTDPPNVDDIVDLIRQLAPCAPEAATHALAELADGAP